MHFDEFPWERLPDTGAMRQVRSRELYQLLADPGDPESTDNDLPRSSASPWQKKTSPLKKTPWQAHLLQLSSPYAEKRLGAIRAMKQAGREVCMEAEPYLREVLGDDSALVGAAAAEALGLLGEAAPREALVFALTDPSWDVRAAAAQSLGNMGSLTPIADLLKSFAREQDETVREAIVRALGRQGHKMPIGTLINVLRHDESWLVREAAAWALGERGEDAPIRPLLEAFSGDEDEYVRAAAARALGQTGDPDTYTFLDEALEDSSEEVFEAASWALQQIENRLLDGNRRKDAPRQPDESLIRWLSAYWSTSRKPLSQHEHAFLALTQFLGSKKGWVRQTDVRLTSHGPILFLECVYESAVSPLQEATFQPIKDAHLLRPLETAYHEHDLVVQEAVQRAFETRKQRSWYDLLIISFALACPTEGADPDPLRVVVSGMSCQRVRESDPPVLDQLVTAWANMVEEPFFCEQPPDLEDLKIWYQPGAGCTA
jgi:HEAT repeat protein